MPDREKVIKCLELCRKLTNSCEGCPYENVPAVENCMLTMHGDALALLKEQEVEIEQLTRFVNGFSRSAVVPVRCKDCKKKWSYDCHITSLTGLTPSDYWFCADGERKDNGGY